MAPAKGDLPSSQEFTQIIAADDELGSVVRTHLMIEFRVEELLELHAPNPAALSDMQLDYFGKVNLLGVFAVATRLTKPLLNLGNLRNSFAHRLNFKLTNDRMRALYNGFDEVGKTMVQHALDDARKQSPDQWHPPNIWALPPKYQFCLLATSLWAGLMVAADQRKGITSVR
jgi:hypothetical protein